MKNSFTIKKLLFLLAVFSTMASCQRESPNVWENTKTAGRYMGKGFRSLTGKTTNTKDEIAAEQFDGSDNLPFTPLDEDLYQQTSYSPHQSSYIPGELGGPIPGIDGFKLPETEAEKAAFANIHFEYNEFYIRDEANFEIVNRIAQFMKEHPNLYLFIEGHTDQIGPAAYNFALGSQRSNQIRNLLIEKGVDLNHIFTVSYGKERLLVHDDSAKARAQNRRDQFKLFYR